MKMAAPSKKKIAEAIKAVKELLGPEEAIEVSKDAPELAPHLPVLTNARVKLSLADEHGLVIDTTPSSDTVNIFRMDATEPEEVDEGVAESRTRTKPTARPTVDRLHHVYEPPHFHQRIVDLLVDDVPHNIMLVGPSGCGKTEEAHLLAEQLGRRLHQINCQREMEKAAFAGDRTVLVDEKTKQNFVKFIEGPLVESMEEGLNEDGEEVGEPGILFIDEFAALPAELGIGLNRVLETRHAVRRYVLDMDGGREVRSHSGWRVVLAANTVGRGLNSQWDIGYTAQGDALDVSTLNRVTAVFKMGYNRKAEQQILRQKIVDERVIDMVLKLRNAFRDAMRQGELTTPFSTRDIVHVADLYRIWRSLPESLYFGFMSGLSAEECNRCNELAIAETSIDVVKKAMTERDETGAPVAADTEAGYDYF
jgi:DNA polymerase III delta prime subunit